MHRSLVLDGSASKCKQIAFLSEPEDLPERALSPPSSAHCLELQPYFRYRHAPHETTQLL